MARLHRRQHPPWFYRLAGQSAIRQLKALERHQDNLILGDQLRMEFMNNRQLAIIAGIDRFSTRPERPALPAIFSKLQPAKTWIKIHGTAETNFKKVKSRIETILEPISKSSEEDNEAGELDKAEEVLSVVLPADEDATLPLYPGEEALDEPSPRVTA